MAFSAFIVLRNPVGTLIAILQDDDLRKSRARYSLATVRRDE